MITKGDYREDLLPCPFCGHPAKLISKEVLYGWGPEKRYFIGCSNSACYMQPGHVGGMSFPTKDAAIACWMKRSHCN